MYPPPACGPNLVALVRAYLYWFLLAGVLLALWAQWRLRSAYRRWSGQASATRPLTGAAAAQHRRNYVRVLNEEMMNTPVGAGHGGVVGREVWEKLPAFRYDPPPSAQALRAAALGYGLWNGSGPTQRHREVATALTQDSEQFQTQLRDVLGQQAVDPKAIAGRGTTAVLPPAPLPLLATGQSDLSPGHETVVLWRLATPADTRSELENPSHLMAGRFDLAFVLVWLYPLFLLALVYDLMAGDQEAGTLRQAVSAFFTPRIHKREPITMADLDKLPDPAVLFVLATVLTWLLSALLAPVQFSEMDPRTMVRDAAGDLACVAVGGDGAHAP